MSRRASLGRQHLRKEGSSSGKNVPGQRVASAEAPRCLVALGAPERGGSQQMTQEVTGADSAEASDGMMRTRL